MGDMMNIGEKIKQLRVSNELTQEELANKLYVTRAAISKWETNNGVPNIESIKDISKLFQVSINELLSEDVLTDYTTWHQKNWLNTFMNLGYAIMDFIIFTLMFLPLFSIRIGDYFKAVSLFNHNTENLPLTITYYFVFLGHIILSVYEGFYKFRKTTVKLFVTSTVFSLFGLFVFIISNEPYISFFITIFIVMKVLLLFKNKIS